MNNLNNESNDYISDSLVNDSIGRNKYLFNFIKILSKIDGYQVIGLNGEWGSGKTFFVKQLEILLNVMTNYDDEGNVINEEIRTNNLRCLKELKQEKLQSINFLITKPENNFRSLFEDKMVNCLYFNAWEYDNNEDPILSIIYKIIRDFPYLTGNMEEEKFSIFKTALDAAGNVLSKGNVANISDYFSSSSLLDRIVTSEDKKEKVKGLLNELLNENCDQMIIIIDELDRCKPTYALKLIEEIKHYVNDDRIIVILATNIHQLSNTIKNVYGANFDSDEYLDKVIDFQFSIPRIDRENYINLICDKGNCSYNNPWHEASIKGYPIYKDLELRSINRFISMMNLFSRYIATTSTSTYNLLNYVFLPYCIGEQLFDSNNFKEFITGNGFDNFYKYVSGSKKINEITKRTIYYPSSRSEDSNLKEDLNQIYNYMFSNVENESYLEIQNIELNGSDKKQFHELCSILSEFTIE